jgi:hypothetical protein
VIAIHALLIRFRRGDVRAMDAHLSKEILMSRFSLLFVLAAGCIVAEPAPAYPTQPAQPAQPAPPPMPVSGAGNWATTWYWGTGSCGLMGQLASSLTVNQSQVGYMIQESDPNVAVNGNINCDYNACKMLVSETSSLNGAPANVSINFALAADGTITGSGSVSLTSPQCTQQFTARGRRT